MVVRITSIARKIFSDHSWMAPLCCSITFLSPKTKILNSPSQPQPRSEAGPCTLPVCRDTALTAGVQLLHKTRTLQNPSTFTLGTPLCREDFLLNPSSDHLLWEFPPFQVHSPQCSMRSLGSLLPDSQQVPPHSQRSWKLKVRLWMYLLFHKDKGENKVTALSLIPGIFNFCNSGEFH